MERAQIAHALAQRLPGVLRQVEARVPGTLSEARTRLPALPARIRPPVVFNALDIIAPHVRTDPEKAEKAIGDMADLFCIMLSEDEPPVPVKNEVEVAKQYPALENLQLHRRRHADWELSTFLRKAVMPILTRQAPPENAVVRHVGARLWEETGAIDARVTKPVPRCKERITTNHVQSLDNIRRRFHNHYSDAASLAAVESNGQFGAGVVLPIREDKI